MISSVIISLDTRRAKKDSSYPIIFRLSHINKTLPISSGYSVPKKFWDIRNRKIRSGYKGFENVALVNNFLEKEKARYIDILTRLNDNQQLSSLSINEIKDKLVSKNKLESFFDYTEKLITVLFEEKRVGNALSYANTLREVKKYRKNKDFFFTELNYNFLKQLEANHLSKGLSPNGLAVYMRTIRAIYNKAIKDNVAEKENYPFEKYTIKTTPTKKRAISMEAINKIVNLSYESCSPLFDVRNIFLMSFYLMGAPFVDLAFLKLSNIVDGRVQYKRQKTGKFYDIKITDNLRPIIDYYVQGKAIDDFLLPFVKRTSLNDRYKDVMWARKRYNTRLKEIAKDAGIEVNLTSYVSRHSFASIANNMAIPLTAISEMLGHQKLTTTQVYLANLQKDTIDKYNEQIISSE